MEEIWLWCLQCERAFKVKVLNFKAVCGYEDCGGRRTDLWKWEAFRELHRDYPEIPVEGVTYPL